MINFYYCPTCCIAFPAEAGDTPVCCNGIFYHPHGLIEMCNLGVVDLPKPTVNHFYERKNYIGGEPPYMSVRETVNVLAGQE